MQEIRLFKLCILFLSQCIDSLIQTKDYTIKYFNYRRFINRTFFRKLDFIDKTNFKSKLHSSKSLPNSKFKLPKVVVT